MYGSGGLFGPVYDVLKPDPVLKQMQFDINPAIAGYYRSRASELEGQRDKDLKYQDAALGAYGKSLPGLEASNAADQAYLESMRPGGAQENRFSDLIRGYMDKARAASQVGLQRARAGEKAKAAIGGAGAFADSGYRAKQRNAMEAGYEADLAEKEGAAQLNNANQFLRGYRPGASLALATDAQRYRTVPLAVRGQTEQLGAGRAGNVLTGLRGAIDTSYKWEQPKNFWTYAQAADETIGNIYSLYSSIASGGALGGMGGMGGGGGGGGGGNATAASGGGGALGGFGSYGSGGGGSYWNQYGGYGGGA